MNTILMSDLLSGKDIDNIVSKAMLQKVGIIELNLELFLYFIEVNYRMNIEAQINRHTCKQHQ